MTRIVEVNRFNAVRADGSHIELVVYQELREVRTRGGVHSLSGLKRIKTADGRSVNRDEKGKYELVSTGETLTSDDPDAE